MRICALSSGLRIIIRNITEFLGNSSYCKDSKKIASIEFSLNAANLGKTQKKSNIQGEDPWPSPELQHTAFFLKQEMLNNQGIT